MGRWTVDGFEFQKGEDKLRPYKAPARPLLGPYEAGAK